VPRWGVLPRTKYAKSGEVNIAYQVFGDGDLDLVFIPGFVSHLEFAWEHPPTARFLERLASFARVICFDKRDTGLSDRTGVPQTLEDRMDDVRAVMDAVGSDTAALLGISEGGPLGLLFAATYPRRTRALVIYGSYARMLRSEDYPQGVDPELFRPLFAGMAERWGTGAGLTAWAPSLKDDQAARDWWARFQRLAASPGTMRNLMLLYEQIDVRHVLPTISAPTLVLHKTDDRMIYPAMGRLIADSIPGARWVELPGTDHFFFSEDPDTLLGEIEEFLTGARPAAEPDRVLATILFTDVVDSTKRAATIGDQRWRDMLEQHRAMVRKELERSRGREVDTIGDGFLATFDGPARAIRCALAIVETARAQGLEIRAGLHTGEVEVMGDDIGGIAVHTAARVSAAAGPSEVLVSSTVRDLVAGSGLEFEERGTHQLKGVPGEWRLLAVAS